MKIVFICSSLEPGSDGVGDYTRLLAAELIRRGNNAAILALNDRHSSKIIEQVQLVGDTGVHVLRIPVTVRIKERVIVARRWIDQHNPEWLSLQFVPFGFQNKGLNFGLSRTLLKLGKGRRWHIMFHELWVGMEVETTPKMKWWGWVQRFLIKSMISNISPTLIQTQTRLYQLQLEKLGFQANYLPVFSNIPVVERTISDSKKIPAGQNAAVIRLLVFGEIHKGAPVDSLAREVAAYEKEKQVKIILTFLGRSEKKEQDRWMGEWHNNGLAAEILGELPPNDIARIFSNANLGISLTAFAISDKSGSFAAMKAFGLKALCVSRPWTPRGFNDFIPPNDLFEYTKGSFESFMSSNLNVRSINTSCETATKLLDDILHCG